MRLLVLCTHNSARSQMAEGWLRHYCQNLGLNAEVFSAGTEKTRVKPDAITVMAEVGIDLSGHSSKTMEELPDTWNFDVVMTVCDSANEHCPVYPAKTTRLHVAFPDPSGKELEEWRRVRDAIGATCRQLVTALSKGQALDEALLKAEVGVQL
jgi:arsenate reductase